MYDVGLLSLPTAVVAVVLAIAAPVATALFWNRPRRHRWARVAVRAVGLASAQVLAVAAVGVLLNRDYQFYSSWTEAFGGPALKSTVAPGPAPDPALRLDQGRLRAAYDAGHGTVVSWQVTSDLPGIPHSEPGLVYLPAAYGDPATPARRFPVVELLDGFPGGPGTWTNALHVQQTLDTLIARDEALPFIAVMPTQNVAYPHDTECVNALGGPPTDTYLTEAVHAQVLTDFRALPQRSAWALMGYSTGGYCAMNLALRHPDLYGAAVSLSGTDRAAHDRTTGDLFGSDVALERANEPVWEVQHPTLALDLSGQLDILAVAGRQERVVYDMAIRLVRRSVAPVRVTAMLVAHGTHNAELWGAAEPQAFNWLSQRMTDALVTLAPDGAQLYTVPVRVPLFAPERVPVWTAHHVLRRADGPPVARPTDQPTTGAPARSQATGGAPQPSAQPTGRTSSASARAAASRISKASLAQSPTS